jgi:hypothetical protein
MLRPRPTPARPDLLARRHAPPIGGESLAARATRSMRLIAHRGRIAALAAERVYYASHIEVLEPDHPERRFVAALCLYSRAVDTGEAGRADYRHEEAERFARALLMPAEDFDASASLLDADLAERFVAPLDHVSIRRSERSRTRT